MGVSFYLIGFATAAVTTFMPDSEDTHWLTSGIAAAALVLVISVSLAGANFFAKFNIGFFIVQTAVSVGPILVVIPAAYYATPKLDHFVRPFFVPNTPRL